MRSRVWLIGGTQESVELARSLATASLACIISVTTEAARALYAATPDVVVWVGRLDTKQLPTFIQEYKITAILDASHPFAVEISQLAIATSTQLGIPYLRYERSPLSTPVRLTLTAEAHPSLPIFPNFPALLASNLLDQQRVLLTIGYRPLPLFQSLQERATLFARILPSPTALTAAIAAGFAPDRLVALRPPIPIDLERALWQHWRISLVVTKASGAAGGEAVKQQLAAELGISLVTIARPDITYPRQTSDLAIALQFCHQHLL